MVLPATPLTGAVDVSCAMPPDMVRLLKAQAPDVLVRSLGAVREEAKLECADWLEK
jgi:hypothetical protein